MPGKRKRNGNTIEETSSSENGNAKPISAVAAAKLRSQKSGNSDSHAELPLTPSEAPIQSDYEDEEPGEETSMVKQNVQLCTWSHRENDILDESNDQMTVSLNKNTTITLIGCFELVVLKGAINVNGANYAANRRRKESGIRHRVFVPSTHPISSIKGLDSTNEIQFWSCEKPAPFANLSPLFENIWNARLKKDPARSFSLITESNEDSLKRAITPELVPDDWTRQIEECASGYAVTLVAGAPYSGKSTFTRRLLNRYLTGLGKNAQPLSSIHYLDLDSSKPNYSPHGQISLTLVREVDLGPSFLRPSTMSHNSRQNEIIRAHSLPIRGLSNYQEHFLACVEDLYSAYSNLQLQSHATPLIINTPGWLHNSLDILLHILSHTKARYLVHLADLEAIDEENSAKLDALDTAARKCNGSISHISAQTPLPIPSRTDAELRSMQMLSYFHCTGFLSSTPPDRTWNSKPLSHSTPWDFCYEETSDLKQSFIGFLNLAEWIEPSQLFTTLNGSVVQVVETSDSVIQHQYKALPRTHKYHIPYFPKSLHGVVEPLNPNTSQLVCTALLRSWDPHNRTLQLVVPKTHEALLHGLVPEKTVFVFGCCETPDWAYMEDAYYEAAQRTKEKATGGAILQDMDLPPWVERADEAEEWGYLNAVRRVRKFQQ